MGKFEFNLLLCLGSILAVNVSGEKIFLVTAGIFFIAAVTNHLIDVEELEDE